MNEIVISDETIRELQTKDKLFGEYLANSRRDMLALIRSVPAYLQYIQDSMQRDDVYRAVIPTDVLRRIASGELEPMLKNASGLWNGTIRRSDGAKQFVKQAEFVKVKLDNNSIRNLGQMSLQASIADISDQLLVVGEKLDALAEGQHIDRVAKILSGVQLYEQASLCRDKETRVGVLTNALQSLNEGRTELFGELTYMLTSAPREPVISDMLWKIFGVDKREADYFNKCSESRSRLIENIRQINLGSAYLFRTYALLDEPEAANRSRIQYLEFCDLVLGGIREEDSVHPYELVEATRSLLVSRAASAEKDDKEITVEFSYGEIANENV